MLERKFIKNIDQHCRASFEYFDEVFSYISNNRRLLSSRIHLQHLVRSVISSIPNA